jgi:hypothetical protein
MFLPKISRHGCNQDLIYLGVECIKHSLISSKSGGEEEENE